VAAFGQRLRGEPQLADYGYDRIAELANGARGDDPEGYRAEFVKLVRMAETLGQAGAGGQP
jgi:Ca-activated chloride channel family protein